MRCVYNTQRTPTEQQVLPHPATLEGSHQPQKHFLKHKVLLAFWLPVLREVGLY